MPRTYSGPREPGRARLRREGQEAMLHQAEFGLGREQRLLDMHKEIERGRLESRLRSARREQEAAGGFYAEIGQRRSMIARGASLAMALFR